MKKNGWFIGAGVLAILEAISYFIASLALFLTAAIAGSDSWIVNQPDGTQQEIVISELIPFFIFFAVLMAIFFVISIIIATIYLKNASKSYDELHQKSGKIITTIVFSFITGGMICGILGIIGFNTNNSETNNQQQTPENNYTSSNTEDISKRLEQLKNMKESGIVSEEEYETKKKEILRDL